MILKLQFGRKKNSSFTSVNLFMLRIYFIIGKNIFELTFIKGNCNIFRRIELKSILLTP